MPTPPSSHWTRSPAPSGSTSPSSSAPEEIPPSRSCTTTTPGQCGREPPRKAPAVSSSPPTATAQPNCGTGRSDPTTGTTPNPTRRDQKKFSSSPAASWPWPSPTTDRSSLRDRPPESPRSLLLLHQPVRHTRALRAHRCHQPGLTPARLPFRRPRLSGPGSSARIGASPRATPRARPHRVPGGC